jgi:hypothetical protein
MSGQLYAPVALTPRKRVPSTHCIGEWVGRKPSLGAADLTKITFSRQGDLSRGTDKIHETPQQG